MVTTLILLAWTALTAGIKIRLDAKGRKPNYVAEFCVFAPAAIVHAVLVLPHPSMILAPHHSMTPFEYWFAEWFGPLVPYIPVFLYQCLSYWVAFEFGLNWVQGRRGFRDGLGLLYYDHKEFDSGWIDGAFGKIYKWTGTHHIHTAAKIFAAILAILSAALVIQWAQL